MKKTAVIGFGAVGASFGSRLYEYYKDDFAVAADTRHAAKLAGGITVNGTFIQPAVLNADTAGTQFIPDLLLVCVKNYDLADTLKQIHAITDSHTIILSILNGISAADILKKEFPDNEILRGFARIMAVRNNDGSIKYSGGHIFFGRDDNDSCHPAVLLTKQILDEAGIQVTVCSDIQREVWNKFMINIGTNQVSALTGADYPHLRNIPELYNLMRQAMMETVQVAQAYHIGLTEKDIDIYCSVLNDNQKGLTTSTAQDIAHKRRTEIDYFSGTLIRYAEAKHIDVPVNRALYALIKGTEKIYLEK